MFELNEVGHSISVEISLRVCCIWKVWMGVMEALWCHVALDMIRMVGMTLYVGCRMR